MGRRLIANVHVVLDPETGEAAWFGPSYPENGEPPAELVTNPLCWSDDGEDEAAEDEGAGDDPAPESAPAEGADDGPDGDESDGEHDLPEAPPRDGPGASKAAWRDYAEVLGIQVPDNANRADIIAAVDAATA